MKQNNSNIKLRPDNDADWDTKDDSLLKGSTNPIDTDADVTKQKFIEIDGFSNNATICISCIVCGEGVPLSDIELYHYMRGSYVDSKICDKCKQAILHIRKQIDENKI